MNKPPVLLSIFLFCAIFTILLVMVHFVGVMGTVIMGLTGIAIIQIAENV